MRLFGKFLILFLETIGDSVIFIGKLLLHLLLWLGDIIIAWGSKFIQFVPQTFEILYQIIRKRILKMALNATVLLKEAQVFIKKFNRLIKSYQLNKFFGAKLTIPRIQLLPLVKTSLYFFKKLSYQAGQFFLSLSVYLKKIGQIKIYLPKITLPKSGLKPKIKTIKFNKPSFIIQPHFPKIPDFVWGFFLGGAIVFFGIFVPYEIKAFLSELPHPKLLSQRIIPVTTQIFDKNGALLYEIHGAEDRKPVTLAQIPQVVKLATLAIEDKNFYKHPGFSLTAIARAARETFINKNVQGGSTITQQLIKNALLSPEVTWQRKIKELILAFWAEQIYTKDQILEMYFNQVPYGGTAWGIEAAAEIYFGKQVSDLTLAEAAFLAGMPAAPTYYSPHGQRPDLAKQRQKEVLSRMVDDGYITQNEMDEALQQELHIIPPLSSIKAPHFVMWVRSLVAEKFGSWAVEQGGLRIYTTLDLQLQEQVQKIVTENINQLAPLQVGNGAAIVANPKTGEVLAMVGSKDYFDTAHDGNVNVTIAPRQPGSAIKVVTYAAALENGLTAATVINDSPVAFQIPGSSIYKPVNYDGLFHGDVTLRQALANSYNIPAVKVLNQIGVDTMIEMGRRLGITTWENESRFGLSLTLGGGEVTLYELTQVYAVLANQGKFQPFDPFIKITDFTGRIYYERQNKSKQALSPAIAFILSDILADNQARSAAFGLHSALYFPNHTVAVKTGTTNDKRDNWTLGYTPDIVVGVWVGNNDNSPMNPYLTSGVTGAAPIFNQIMNYLLQNQPNKPFIKPAGIVELPCRGKVEYFVAGTVPKNGCPPIPTVSPFPQQALMPSPSLQLINVQPSSKNNWINKKHKLN